MSLNFPHNLRQAGFCSSVDALLLAGFAKECALHQKKHGDLKFIELGAGSGMASLALCSELVHAKGLGLDLHAQAIEAAKLNARAIQDTTNMPLSARLQFFCISLSSKKALLQLCEQQNFLQAPIVIANPPYHDASKGRISPHKERATALHGDSQNLHEFCAAAKGILMHKGYFCVLFSPSRLAELCRTLEHHKFGIKRILPIHTRKDRSAQWILVEARKNTTTDIRIDQGLQLYADQTSTIFTAEALAFCPWLKN